jgi:hypothetical protein
MAILPEKEWVGNIPKPSSKYNDVNKKVTFACNGHHHESVTMSFAEPVLADQYKLSAEINFWLSCTPRIFSEWLSTSTCTTLVPVVVSLASVLVRIATGNRKKSTRPFAHFYCLYYGSIYVVQCTVCVVPWLKMFKSGVTTRIIDTCTRRVLTMRWPVLALVETSNAIYRRTTNTTPAFNLVGDKFLRVFSIWWKHNRRDLTT